MSPRVARVIRAAAASVAIAASGLPASAQHAVRRATDGRPDATIDLRTREGAAAVRGAWRYTDVVLTPATFNAAGPDGKPSGPVVQTSDLTIKPGGPSFANTTWQPIDASSLEDRRGHGKASFGWYRIDVIVPERVGAFATAGSTVVFEIVVDDYAEVWVDGKLPRALGQAGARSSRASTRRTAWSSRATRGRDRGSSSRCSAPTGRCRTRRRTSSGCDRRRSTSIDRRGRARASEPLRRDREPIRRSTRIVPAGRAIEKLADGFLFTEGPVWVPRGLSALQRSQRQHDLPLDGRRRRCRCSAPRAATPAPTSASTGSRARTASRWIARGGSRSTSTATAA